MYEDYLLIMATLLAIAIAVIVFFLKESNDYEGEEYQKKVIMELHKKTLREIEKVEKRIKGQLVFKAELTDGIGRKLVIAFDEERHYASIKDQER